MKPIFILAMVAIGAGVIGAGSLNNEIVLTLQDFGVGSEIIESPITEANINYTIEATTVGEDQDAVLKNLITQCEFSSPDAIEGDYTIICKLTNIDRDVVAEGRALGSDYVAGDLVLVDIDLLAFEGANAVTNIHDTTLIVMEDAVPVIPTNSTG